MKDQNTSGKRLSFLILNILKVKPLQFSKRIGINPTYLSQLRNEHKPFTLSVAYKISEAYPRVNANWIFTGTGEPMKNEESEHALQPEVNEPQAEYKAERIALEDVPELLRAMQKRISALEERVRVLENQVKKKNQSAE